MANPLDRLIGFFSPGTEYRRVIDRFRVKRAYEAASPRDTWKPRRGGASAQSDHLADAATLRNKARALVQNVPYVETAIGQLVANVVGTGIGWRYTGPQADRLNALLAKWSPSAGADGEALQGLVALAYRAMEIDGEVLLRVRPRRPSDNLPLPLQFQLLEIDWLDTSKNSGVGNLDGTPAGNVVVEGIEFDQIGRVAAYYLFDQHPGDVTLGRGMRNKSSRVPAYIDGQMTVVHLFERKRPGQTRGITRLAPIIARARDTQLYEDAHLARKNLEARLSVLASGDASELANDYQTSTGADVAANTATARATGDLGELSSGGITELPAGTTVTFVDPKVTGDFVPYISLQIHIIVAALGVTYEMATGILTDANFSSARTGMLNVRRGFQHSQWNVVIPDLCAKMADIFAQTAILSGKVSDAPYGVEFDPPEWDYVNPDQEVNADLKEISGGLASISGKLRARGANPDVVFKELEDDFKKLKANGVLDTLFFLQKGTLSVKDGAQAQTDASAAQRAEATLDGITQIVRSQDQRLANIESRDIEVTVNQGDTNVTVPERSVTVEAGDVHVAPPTVVNEVNPTPVTTEVRVEAPNVTVTNDVMPTPVTVENRTDVHVPEQMERTIESETKRGTDGVMRTRSVETLAKPKKRGGSA